MKLADKIKEELTQRARNAESSKYLLDYVMNCFRNGENPVEISANKTAVNGVKPIYDVYNKSWQNAVGYKGTNDKIGIDIKYVDGVHYAKVRYDKTAKWFDVSSTDMAQCMCVDGKDESDKVLYLTSEGFKVVKTFEYGKGDVLKVYY